VTVVEGQAPTYGQLLHEAWELGRADGRFAAAFEAAAVPPGRVDRCLGRTPAEFARMLWRRPGVPPTGLEVNGPLWYASGFREGLAAGAERNCRTAALQFRRVFR
jgi:hypothetical protein